MLLSFLDPFGCILYLGTPHVQKANIFLSSISKVFLILFWALTITTYVPETFFVVSLQFCNGSIGRMIVFLKSRLSYVFSLVPVNFIILLRLVNIVCFNKKQDLMLEVVSQARKEAIFKNFKNLLVNFRLTTVINLHQTIFTQNY